MKIHLYFFQKMMREQMREKAKTGELKIVDTGPKQKIGEKKKRRWDQAAGGDDTPAKKKATTWDQAEVGTPSQVSLTVKLYIEETCQMW